MASSYHDNSHVPTLVAVQSDGKTVRNIEADPTAHSLNTSNGGSGTDNGPTNSLHDGNHTPILMATSSADGKTPVAVYADANGNLLVDSV